MENRKLNNRNLGTNQAKDDKNKPSLSRKVWQMYLQVGFIGLLIAATLWYAMDTGTQIAKRYSPLVDAAMEIKLQATTAHLWFEEYIGGDSNIDINEVWNHIDHAEWYAQAMLEGGQSDEGTFIPLDDPKLREYILEVKEKIKNFRAIAEERLANTKLSNIGSDIDQRFDSVFNNFLAEADEVETALQQIMARDLKRFRTVQISLLLLCLVLTGIIGVILHRFQRRQSVNLLRLETSNQQLKASEQQLRAANQQLEASEQQLRASNQQLRASEQQQKAINQQLIAGEQQLKAANQQLIASEQQLKSSNQQLRGSEQQLKASNQQLRASEQQLTASNQQLTASEQQLKASNQQLKTLSRHNRMILDTAGEGIYGLDLDGNTTFVNPAAARMIGWEPDEIIGKNQHKLLHHTKVDGTPYDANDCPIYAAYKKGNTYHIDSEVFWRKDGSSFPVEYISSPIRDEDGNIEGAVVTFMDISERHQAKAALQKSEADYRSTIDNLLVGVVVHGSDSSILLSNPEASNILGLTAEQMSGKEAIDPAWSFMHEDLSKMKVEDYPVSKVMATKKPLNGYIVGVNRPDRSFVTWVDVSAIPILSNGDELDKIIINFIDITETKRLQELESRAQRLELAGTIAGQVAHDFNNLLAPVIAYPDFIRDELPHDHKALIYLEPIENAAKKIADINQDLLAMGRRGHYNQEILDVNRVIMQSVQELESRSRTVTFEMNLCEDLMKIKGGNAQINRMLTNLLVNAQDAMGGIGQVIIKTENYYADDTSIEFGRVPKGEYIKLTVTDNGCGIPENIMQNILDPFFSTKSADKKRGSGLGLSVVDAVIKDHNGYLDMSSKVGHGTSFYVYFPVTREVGTKGDSAHLANGTEKVLVVDDDRVQREVTTSLLTKQGYKVKSVESGEKAVELLKTDHHDLIILDMVMPGGIDGAETYRQIIEFSPAQKAIIVSGFSESDRVMEAQKLGAGAFVKKPVTIESISGAVRTELDRPIKALES